VARDADDRPRFLDPEAAEAPYRPMLLGGASLQGAIARPQLLHDYEGVDDLARLAGRQLWAVTRRHALIDGNKRASIVLAEALLALNGARFEDDENALYTLTVDAASGTADEVATVERIRALMRPGAPARPLAERLPGLMRRLPDWW
jgi:death-on-curing protein